MENHYFSEQSIADTLQQFPALPFLNSAKDALKQVIADIKQGYESNIHPELFGLYKGNYHKALAHFGEPQYGDTYFEMLQHFKLNTAKLAAYKSLLVTKQLKDLQASKHFDVEAMATLKKFNRFQAAEYNTIVARSRSAKQFKQFANEAKLFPNIEWIRTRSATPREKHLAFAGLVLPQNHPFWQSNQPGNLWNCKCDWRSTDAPASDYVPKDVTPPPGLEGNPAITGDVITDNHPYINRNINNKKVQTFYNKIVQKELKPIIDKLRNEIDPYKGSLIKSDNLASGQVTILRKSYKEIFNHNTNDKVRLYLLKMNDDIKSWNYLGWAEADKHNEALCFLYYEVNINGIKRYVNMELHESFGEVPYAILNNIDKKSIQKGIPRYLKK